MTISSGSTYAAGPSTTTQLDGAIVNDGIFAINGASGNAIVNLGSAVTLSGGGTVTMTSGARQRVPARQRLDADQHQRHDPGRGPYRRQRRAGDRQQGDDRRQLVGPEPQSRSRAAAASPTRERSKRRREVTFLSPRRFQGRASLKSAPIRRLSWAAPRAKIRPSSAPRPPRFLSITRRRRATPASSLRLSRATSSSLAIPTPPTRRRPRSMGPTRP